MTSSKREMIHRLNYVVDPTLTYMIFVSSMPECAINGEPPFLLALDEAGMILG
jgi:hypothetical protein